MAGRLPDYRLSAMNKSTDEKSIVGGAWLNENGSISIRLDPFVVLTSSKDLVLSLFKRDDKPKERNQPQDNDRSPF